MIADLVGGTSNMRMPRAIAWEWSVTKNEFEALIVALTLETGRRLFS